LDSAEDIAARLKKVEDEPTPIGNLFTILNLNFGEFPFYALG
jgi:hypothetical protein